jgi:hypothetical protein
MAWGGGRIVNCEFGIDKQLASLGRLDGSGRIVSGRGSSPVGCQARRRDPDQLTALVQQPASLPIVAFVDRFEDRKPEVRFIGFLEGDASFARFSFVVRPRQLER